MTATATVEIEARAKSAGDRVDLIEAVAAVVEELALFDGEPGYGSAGACRTATRSRIGLGIQVTQ
jgi:hypothetical protein